MNTPVLISSSAVSSFRIVRKVGCHLRHGFFSALLLVLAVQPAAAINIVMQLQQENMNPSNDLSGQRLKKIADVAAEFWMDYLPESGTYEIDIWWDADEFAENTDAWGQWSFEAAPADNNIRINPNPTSGGDPVQWFFDPSPKEHSEFDFTTQDKILNIGLTPWTYRGGQWLYRDVDPVEQAFWFGDNPPDVMEIGYRGRATSSVLQGQADLLSTVIHEIGHELGVNDTGGPWEADPAWLPGGSATFFENGAEDHLAARTALMCGGCGLIGTRRLPSAVDIMAAADDEDMGVIDLPRQDYIGDGLWHMHFNWTGGFLPDSGDDAFLRDDNSVQLFATATVKNLSISNSSTLQVESSSTLNVSKQTTVSDVGGGGTLRVNPNAVANLDTLTVAGGDLITFPGAVVDVADDLVLTTQTTGGMTGVAGAIAAHGGTIATGGKLVNDGEIIALDDTTTFNFTGTSVNKFDLDGAKENGVVKALFGNLIFDGQLTDAFNSQMVVEAGREITMNDDWTLGGAGVLRLIGTPGNAAVVKGHSRMTVKGSVDADVGLINADNTQFDDSASVSVVDSADRLVLDTDALMLGGTYTGNGAIEQQGDITVDADVTIDVNEFDWGNSAAGDSHVTSLVEGATFTIESATTGTPRNEYRGTIYVSGARLEVNLDSGWLLPRRKAAGAPAGTLNLNAGDADHPRVSGVPLTVEGNVRANGGAAIINADFITTQWADIRALVGAELLLMGHNTYDGGTIYGDGEIVQAGDTDVVSDTTINTMFYDLDGIEVTPSSTTIQPGVTFTINSQRIDKPGEPFNGFLFNNGGTLAVNTPAAWTIVGRLELTNDNGPAWVTGAPIVVEGRILTIGGNEIFTPVTFHNDGQVTADGPGDILRLRNHTNYEGGIYTGAGGIIQDADAFVNAPTVIDLGFFDMDGVSETSFLELHADLTLNVDRVDMNDNQFNGILEVTDPAKFTVNTPSRWTMAGMMNIAGAAGTKVTIDGAKVVLANDVFIDQSNELEFGADVSGPGNFTGGGDVVFLGEYSPGNSPAMVTADGHLAFADSASFLVDIGGTAPGTDHDALVVGEQATLAGTLDATLINDFQPAPGNEFTILETMSGSVIGAFDAENLPIFNGLTFDVIYDLQSVVLQVIDAPIVPGDYNQNGVVDTADYTVWRDTLGSTTNLAADGNSNNEIDAGDYAVWKTNFGATLGSGANEVAAVPEPAAIVLGAFYAIVSLLLNQAAASQRGRSSSKLPHVPKV